MARRAARRTRSRASGRGGRSRYYPHIYFESKRPRTPDSVYQAVHDIGKPGVNTAKEVKLLAFAQLADLYDGYTRNHQGHRVRFTGRLWAGRLLVLKRLANRYGGKRAVELIQRYKQELEEARSRTAKREILLEAARKLDIPRKQAEEIIRKGQQVAPSACFLASLPIPYSPQSWPPRGASVPR